jgi:DNA polymerase I-like protein with 3'-5' exonuclease and polymerase domains
MYRIYLRLRGGDWTAPPRYGARILFCVHDEIVTTAPEKHVEEVSEIMKVCMQEAYDDVIKSVKNTVDVTVGDYWKK